MKVRAHEGVLSVTYLPKDAEVAAAIPEVLARDHLNSIPFLNPLHDNLPGIIVFPGPTKRSS